MNKRFFKFAREASRFSTYKGSHNFCPHIGAVCEYKGTIIGRTWNSDKTSTMQARYNVYRYSDNSTLPKVHAEMRLLQQIRWKFGDSINWKKVHIYTYREYKDGKLANSRPCPACLEAMRQAGIKKFMYTTEEGYAEEKFK